jgi:preprotein translocase subunit SecG
VIRTPAPVAEVQVVDLVEVVLLVFLVLLQVQEGLEILHQFHHHKETLADLLLVPRLLQFMEEAVAAVLLHLVITELILQVALVEQEQQVYMHLVLEIP